MSTVETHTTTNRRALPVADGPKDQGQSPAPTEHPGSELDRRLLEWIATVSLQSSHVLHVGPNQETISITLAKSGKSVTGVDSDAGSIGSARRAAESETGYLNTRLTFVYGDLSGWSAGKGKFDHVVAVDCFEQLADEDKAKAYVTKIAYMLGKNGSLALTFDFSQNAPALTAAKLLRLLVEFFNVESVAVIEGRLCLFARRRTATETKSRDLDDALAEKLLEAVAGTVNAVPGTNSAARLGPPPAAAGERSEDLSQRLHFEVAANEEMRRRVDELTRHNELLKKQNAIFAQNSLLAKAGVRYRIGDALVMGLRSPIGALKFPVRLLLIARDLLAPRSRRALDAWRKRRTFSFDERKHLRQVARAIRNEDADGARARWETMRASPTVSPRAIAQGAQMLALSMKGTLDGDRQALQYMQTAVELDPSPQHGRELARIAFRIGNLSLANEAIELWLRAEKPFATRTDSDWYHHAKGWLDLKYVGVDLTPTDKPLTYARDPKSVIYCLHNSLPHDSGGYATRSHGILTAMAARSWTMSPYTRPGYPWDRPDAKGNRVDRSAAPQDEIDGLIYRRFPGVKLGYREHSIYDYLHVSAELFAEAIKRNRASLIHAASNYFTGLPAIRAARMVGVPSIYEVRGLWEITRVSRDPVWGDSERFQLDCEMEALVAREASHVLTLTAALRDELVTRGVPAEKITIVPNSVDVDRFVPKERDLTLAKALGVNDDPVIGFIGTFAEYEGLDDLVRVAAVLKARGVRFKLLLVGDGKMSEPIAALVRELGVQDHVIQPGRVPHSEVERYYSLVDVAAFPRKAQLVCEMVSPLKPFEAMAMGKPILVSSVDALKEFVAHGDNGFVFEKGNLDALASTCEDLLTNRELRESVGERGRFWVRENRTWERTATIVESVYTRLIEEHPYLERFGVATSSGRPATGR